MRCAIQTIIKSFHCFSTTTTLTTSSDQQPAFTEQHSRPELAKTTHRETDSAFNPIQINTYHTQATQKYITSHNAVTVTHEMKWNFLLLLYNKDCIIQRLTDRLTDWTYWTSRTGLWLECGSTRGLQPTVSQNWRTEPKAILYIHISSCCCFKTAFQTYTADALLQRQALHQLSGSTFLLCFLCTALSSHRPTGWLAHYMSSTNTQLVCDTSFRSNSIHFKQFPFKLKRNKNTFPSIWFIQRFEKKVFFGSKHILYTNWLTKKWDFF